MISTPTQDSSSKTSKMSKYQILAEKSSLKSVSLNLQNEHRHHQLDYQDFPSHSSRLNNKSPKSSPNSGKSISRLYPRLSNSSSAESYHSHTPNGPVPPSIKKNKSLTFNTKYLLDTGGRMEPHGPSIIYGVESEEVEEINDAYNDLIGDLGELLGDLDYRVSKKTPVSVQMLLEALKNELQIKVG